LYLNYDYETLISWIRDTTIQAMNYTNATTEAENLKTFLSDFNVAE